MISPLLANIFLHHVFDMWMAGAFPGCPFERYADDIVIHCATREEALAVKAQVEQRLRRCQLEAHPDKTRIVYCRDSNRRQDHEPIQFDFLGYGFRPRAARSRAGKIFTGYLPAISRKAAKFVVTQIRGWDLQRRSDEELADLARRLNPQIRGWVAYYGRYGLSVLRRVLRQPSESAAGTLGPEEIQTIPGQSGAGVALADAPGAWAAGDLRPLAGRNRAVKGSSLLPANGMMGAV